MIPPGFAARLLHFAPTLGRINEWAHQNKWPVFWSDRRFHRDFRVEGIGFTFVWRRGFVTTFWVQHLPSGLSKRFALSNDRITSIEVDTIES